MSPESIINENKYKLVTCRSCGQSFPFGASAHYCTGLLPKAVKTVTSDTTSNNGGDTDYYKVPPNAEMLQDLIEYKDMSWNQANIFKATYRLKDNTHSDLDRELNKIIWFAQRMLDQSNHKDN